eukprot:TRINITY_DN84_c0_g1_i1.p1 TRINITY_DN84_c0_g1~~TRINITY_DN84_c0_g1_i1.p1  ORF type:complete len:490 (-),score=31.80 TRINITY_DN84_c0_g1_i1:898-2367(-)
MTTTELHAPLSGGSCRDMESDHGSLLVSSIDKKITPEQAAVLITPFLRKAAPQSVFFIPTSELAQRGLLQGMSRTIYCDPREVPRRRSDAVFTVVLDLDDTLLCAREEEETTPLDTDTTRAYSKRIVVTGYCVRPHAHDFLVALRELCDRVGERAVEVIVWSAGDMEHVRRGVHILDPDGVLIDHVVCRGPEWVKVPPALKDLSMLSAFSPPCTHSESALARAYIASCQRLSVAGSRTEQVSVVEMSKMPDWGGRFGSCVIVDDSPYATVCNGHAALVIPPFQPRHEHAAADSTLLYVLQVLARTFFCVVWLREGLRKPVHEQPVPTQQVMRAGARLDLRAPAFQAAFAAVANGATTEAAAQAARHAVTEHGRLVEREEAFRRCREAPDFMADHPFVDVQPVMTAGGVLHCLRLDVADAVQWKKRVTTFRERWRMIRKGDSPPPLYDKPTVEAAAPALDTTAPVSSDSTSSSDASSGGDPRQYSLFGKA